MIRIKIAMRLLPIGLLIVGLAACGRGSSDSNNVPPPPPAPPVAQCADGIDNDGDGNIDLTDAGCSGSSDDDESDDLPPPVAQCADGIDNDGDGNIDLADAGCSGSSDDDESDDLPQPPLPGLDQRPSNLTCLAPDKSGTGTASVTTVDAFPNLPDLDRPLSLLQAPGDDTRWFVVE